MLPNEYVIEFPSTSIYSHKLMKAGFAGLQDSLSGVDLDLDLELTEVECTHQKGGMSTAKEMLKTWNRKAEETDIRGHLLLGHVHFKVGKCQASLPQLYFACAFIQIYTFCS